jgi:hypothetical protein
LIENKLWIGIQASPCPKAREGHISVTWQTCMYLLGGANNEENSDFFGFDFGK